MQDHTAGRGPMCIALSRLGSSPCSSSCCCSTHSCPWTNIFKSTYVLTQAEHLPSSLHP